MTRLELMTRACAVLDANRALAVAFEEVFPVGIAVGFRIGDGPVMEGTVCLTQHRVGERALKGVVLDVSAETHAAVNSAYHTWPLSAGKRLSVPLTSLL